MTSQTEAKERTGLKAVDPWVFLPSALVIGAFVAWGVLAPEHLSATLTPFLTWVIRTFGWF